MPEFSLLWLCMIVIGGGTWLIMAWASCAHAYGGYHCGGKRCKWTPRGYEYCSISCAAVAGALDILQWDEPLPWMWHDAA